MAAWYPGKSGRSAGRSEGSCGLVPTGSGWVGGGAEEAGTAWEGPGWRVRARPGRHGGDRGSQKAPAPAWDRASFRVTGGGKLTDSLWLSPRSLGMTEGEIISELADKTGWINAQWVRSRRQAQLHALHTDGLI